MEIKKQVTSLEMSKRLRMAGVNNESYFSWWTDKYNTRYFLWDKTQKSDYETGREKEVCCAFSVSELLEIVSNEDIINYIHTQGDFISPDLIDLFRTPDKLAEVILWKSDKNK